MAQLARYKAIFLFALLVLTSVCLQASYQTAGDSKRKSVGYHETEHVRRVYELSRF